MVRSKAVLGPVIQSVVMPPTLKKVRGHIASGLSVHLFVCLSLFLVHSITLEPGMLMF